ncbi:MAG: S8 family serine peptidase [Deltaproteobacteria bacterium]|nr:S8 family serine peptidase [Deltaproteobacteria bacterium]
MVRFDQPMGPEKTTASPGAPPKSPTEMVLEACGAMEPNAQARVFVRLPKREFDFGRFRSTDKAAVEAVLAERKAALAADQSAATAELEKLGAKVVATYWVVNGMTVEIAAGAVASLLTLPLVVELQPVGEAEPSAAYDGNHIRDRTLIKSSFHDNLIQGEDGGLNGDNIRIGVIDQGKLAANHVGWLDWVGGATRVKGRYVCTGSGCTTTTTLPSAETHGTVVTWVAAGSIEQGQDSAFPGSYTSNQIARSGVAREADVYYYEVTTYSSNPKAIERGILDNVDVLNFSQAISACTPSCNPACNINGINDAIKNALQAGIVFVSGGGNGGHTGGCTAYYPGYLPWVVSVNGADTTDSATNYDTSTLLDVPNFPASKGPVAAIRHDGVPNHYQAAIDLVAPGAWTRYFTTGPAGYGAGTYNGCSMAAPVVTAATALLREALSTIGWSTTDAHVLIANLFLMGDRWDFAGGGTRSFGVSEYSGFGRIHMHYPASNNLTAPWYWEWQRLWVQHGATVSWQLQGPAAESTALTQLKWVVAVIDTELTGVPDIDLEVWDTCPAGGGSPVLLEWDYSLDLRSRIVLDASEIGGKCLEMRIKGFSVASGGQWVYSALYNHSGSTADH